MRNGESERERAGEKRRVDFCALQCLYLDFVRGWEVIFDKRDYLFMAYMCGLWGDIFSVCDMEKHNFSDETGFSGYFT